MAGGGDGPGPGGGQFGGSTEVKVKIAAPHQPVLPPSAVPGYPPAVEFTDLVLTPYVDPSGARATARVPTGAGRVWRGRSAPEA